MAAGHRASAEPSREFTSEPDYSDEIAREIDNEIRSVIAMAHESARAILEVHRDKLDRLAEIRLRRETIERDQFIELLEGKSEEEVFLDEEPDRSATRLSRGHTHAPLAGRQRSPGQPAPARTPA